MNKLNHKRKKQIQVDTDNRQMDTTQEQKEQKKGWVGRERYASNMYRQGQRRKNN